MTRDAIRKMIGGYATGSLNEAERKALFEAALDDQEIFDELSREQALKELLAEPGAKQRLIAALQPAAKRPTRQAAWWVRPWPWATAAAAVAIGIVVWIAAPKPPPKREIAEVRTEVAPPQAAEPAQPPAVLHDSQKQTPKARPMATKPEKDTKKEEKLASVDARETVDAQAQVAAPQKEAIPPPPQLSPPPAAAPQAQVQVQIQQPQAPQAAPPFVSQQAGQRADVEQMRSAARAASSAMGKVAAARFAFDYSIEPDGRLSIKPAADGYLLVIARTPNAVRPLLPDGNDGRVTGGSVMWLNIPKETTELSITFSRSTIVGIGGAANRLDRPATVRDALSGTVEDPNPSPNSRLFVTVRLKPRE